MSPLDSNWYRSTLTTVLAVGLLGSCLLSNFTLHARQPNIVFIVADDLGYNELGCYGQEKIRTPHIDRLAAEGMRFTQHYSGNAVCAPSRCVLMTGKHPGHAFIRNNKPIQPEGQYPIPKFAITGINPSSFSIPPLSRTWPCRSLMIPWLNTKGSGKIRLTRAATGICRITPPESLTPP